MRYTINNYIILFFKISIITTLLFGGLLAQSYATTALFPDTVMKMNIEFSSPEGKSAATQKASMTVHNEQESSISFGGHQLAIKTTFITWEDEAKEPEQVLAEIKIQELNDQGEATTVHTPSLMIIRNKWAELKIAPQDGQDGIELKMQFEDFEPANDDNAFLSDPVWLNWDDKTTVNTEAC